MTDHTSLTPYRADFPDAFAALDEWQRDADARRARWAAGRTALSIGVIGQVKAGKSSFLNQLLFGGRELLPAAATPKTANLTRIGHAASPRFTAHFYNPADWATLTQLAASGAEDQAARVARELVRLAQAHHTDVQAVLAQGSVHLEADDLPTLMAQVNDYVGNDGRYTPLVQHTELGLPLPALEGVEIVDTPGMNDPVVSRTAKTRDYMALCDVVFFLSRAGQLVDDSDQELLSSQLPSKGVKRMVLVASQFDAALLDDGHQRKSLAECENRLKERLSRHARHNLAQLADQREQQGMPTVAALLRSVGDPLFTSSYAQAMATLPPSDWSGQVRFAHERFEDLAEDAWNGQMPQTADWLRLGNFAAPEAALAQARADKELLLARQRDTLEAELGASLGKWRRTLHDRASERLDRLQHDDMASLEREERQNQSRLDRTAQALAAYMRQRATAARSQAAEMLAQLQQGTQRASRVESRTGTETHTRWVEVSDSVWYKPWTWGSSHTESYTVTRNYSYLATADAVDNLRRYLDESRQMLLDRFEGLIAPAQLSTGLRLELLKVVDTRSTEFDPRKLRGMVENLLSCQRWPTLEVEAPDPASLLAGLSGELRSEADMAALRQRLSQAAQQLQQTLAERLNRTVQRSCDQLDSLASQLHDELTRQWAEDLERVRAGLRDKAEQVRRLQTLQDLLEKQGLPG